jgi:DNA primase large subunit
MREKNEITSTVVAKINNIEIVVVENGDKKVPVKPICEALGIAFEPQFTRLKNDPILKSVVTLSVTTGADGKQYEMVTIPFKYVFGWLFQIDSRNVKEEAREAVIRYQLECYDALYDHFVKQEKFLRERQFAIDEQIEIVDQLRSEFKDAERNMFEARGELNRRRAITFEQWATDRSQMSLFTLKQMEG